MSVRPTYKILRTVTLAVLLAVVLLVCNYTLGGLYPKTLGVLLAAAATVFFLGETYFWKAIDKLSELPHLEALSASEAKDLSVSIKKLKSRLTQRWILLLVLKAVAGVCAAWLLNQPSPHELQRIIWLAGVGALTVSLPMALTFLRIWQQADEVKTQQLLHAREKKELKAAKEELSKAPALPLEADKLLAGYTKTVASPKSK